MRVVVWVETRLPPQAVWAWWTDYGPEGSEALVDHGFSKTWRTVLRRSERRVEMLERFALPGRPKALRHAVELDPAGRTLVETSPTFLARWSFEATADGAGTRITRAIDLSGLAGLSPAFVVRRMMERDLRAHVREMEADVGLPGGKPAASPDP